MNTGRDAAVLTYVEDAVLNEEEHIVWKGRPAPWASATVHLAIPILGTVLILFGLAWTGFILNYGLPILMAIPGAAGLLYGAKVASPMLINYIRAGRTYYAVTNRRILIITAGRSISVDSVTGSEIKKLQRKEKLDGTGNVSYRFTTTSGPDANNRYRSYTSYGFRDGLWGVSDVAGAANAIEALQQASDADDSDSPRKLAVTDQSEPSP